MGEWSRPALQLAVTTNRRRTITLLLAAGAPLTTVVDNLSLLKTAYYTPDVTAFVKTLVTRVSVYYHNSFIIKLTSLSLGIKLQRMGV